MYIKLSFLLFALSITTVTMAQKISKKNKKANTYKIYEFLDTNFDSLVVNNKGLTVVDFWAPWCGPCRKLTPTIAKIASTYAGKVNVGKLNVDDNPTTATKLSVSSIPLVVFYKDGQVVDYILGIADYTVFEEKIKKYL